MMNKKLMLFFLLILSIGLVLILALMMGANFLFPRSAPPVFSETDSVSSIPVLGSKIYYRVYAGEEPTLILLHGFGGTLEHWKKIQPMLTHNKSIALDLVGFGKSDRSLMTYDLETQRRYLIAFMDKLNVKTAVLVGTSMGGSLAAWATAKTKDRITGVILLAPSGYPGSFTPQFPLNWLYKPGLVNWLSQFIVNNSLFSYLYPNSLAKQALSVTSSYNSEFSVALERIEQPTLLAMSRGDTAIDFNYYAKYKEKIPHLEFFEIPESISHVVLQEYPVGSAKLINDFMNNHQ